LIITNVNTAVEFSANGYRNRLMPLAERPP
jgi:hypothetical protein